MKKASKLDKLIDFLQFTHEFREVIRVARSPKGSRLENDAEHSYQLAMTAWYLIEEDGLRLDKKLCFMYALAHDLVETYAGDTLPYDAKRVATKHRREAQALQKIERRFPRFREMIRIIERYEKRKDKESKFVYALDKLLPPLQCYLDEGYLWHKHKISFEAMSESKNSKIPVSPHVNKYWQALHKELSKHRKKLFPA